MIAQQLHKEVHSALMRRKTISEFWGSPLENGFVGFSLCTHADKDEISISEICAYFERNLNVPDFIHDTRNLAAISLYCGILGKTGQRTKARDAGQRVIDEILQLRQKETSKYSLFNTPELLFFVIRGLQNSEVEYSEKVKEILISSVKAALSDGSYGSMQRTAFFIAATLELGLEVQSILPKFFSELDLSRLQSYDILPSIWLLIKYRENIDEQTKADSHLRGLVSKHSEAIWKQLELQLAHLSFDLAPAPIEEEFGQSENSTHTLSVLELSMLDELLSSLDLYKGVYPPDLYSRLRFNPIVKKKSEKLFKEGNYNQSISETFMALIDAVKEKAGHPKDSNGKELDGANLMNTVFSPNSPILKFNPMSSEVEIDEQKGLMTLFNGSVSAVRNVFHHKSKDEQADPFITIQYLQFASLLLDKLDGVTLVSPTSPPSSTP